MRLNIFPLCMIPVLCAVAAPVEMQIPWKIDAAAPGIGLPQQPGTTHYKLAAPGMDPVIGWANHDPKMIRIGLNPLVNQQTFWIRNLRVIYHP